MLSSKRFRLLPWTLLVGGFGSLAAFVGACSGDGGTGSTTGQACTPDIASIQADILNKSCALSGCHSAADAAGFLDLASASVESRLVGKASSTCADKQLIVPGHPEASFFLEKVLSSKPACGVQMPIGGPLGGDELSCITSWIANMPEMDAGTDASSCETCGGASCVDLMTDPANCGVCGTTCQANAICDAGACVCAGNLKSCNGQCVDTTSDPLNCGACGAACSAAQFCNGSVCSASCGPLTPCGAACVNLSTDSSNCGACGNTCGAGEACVAGACACPGGGVSCNGSCVDTQNDANNCGICGNVCANGQTCAAGKCTCGNSSVSFAADVQPIFTASCAAAGCHKGVVPQAGLDLSTGKAYGKLVNVAATQCADGRKRVLPGDPAQSYLIDKMMGVDLCAGTAMPKLGNLPSAQITTVANWICAGAPNN